VLTATIDVVLRICHLVAIHDSSDAGLLANITEALTQNHDFVAWDGVLLDGLANDLLADTVAVHVRGVPGVQPAVVSCLQDWQRLLLVQDPRLPRLITEGHSTQDWHGHAQAGVS